MGSCKFLKIITNLLWLFQKHSQWVFGLPWYRSWTSKKTPSKLKNNCFNNYFWDSQNKKMVVILMSFYVCHINPLGWGESEPHPPTG